MSPPPLLSSPPLTLGPRAGPARALVVMLHGVGEDAASFHPHARGLAAALPHAEFLTPDGFHAFDRGRAGRQWFSLLGITDENRPARVREAGAEVSAFLDDALDARGLGRDRLAVVGFSQGAIVGAWLAVHRSPSPRAVVMFSGRVALESPRSPGPLAAPGAPGEPRVSTPVFVAHGTDDAVIPYRLAADSVRSLEASGARVTRKTYPGLGHAVGAAALADAARFLAAALGPR